MEDRKHPDPKDAEGRNGAAVPKGELGPHLEQIRDRCQRLCARHGKGYMTEEELNMQLANELYTGFFRHLEKQGVLLRLSAENWQRFLDDHSTWKAGGQPEVCAAQPWLSIRGERADGGAGNGASAEDKAAFFALMEAFCIPPAYFEPFPTASPRPELLPGRTPDERIVGGTGVWRREGGLSPEDPAPGETVLLRDRWGLKAEIAAAERVPDGEKRKRRADWTGVGTIEGYTTAEPHEIRVVVSKGQAFSLAFTADDRDRALLRSFPLWEEWNRYADRKDVLFRSILNGIAERYADPGESL